MVVNNIRKIRKEKKISLVNLGKMAGIVEPSVRRAEKNIYTVKFSTLQKLADALEVSVKDLFYEEKELDEIELESYKKSQMVNEMEKTIDN